MTLIKLASEYFNTTEEDIKNRIKHAQINLNKDWENKESITSFYKNTEHYIFDLINYNTEKRIEEVIYPIKYSTNKNILDFGAGIGEIAMRLSRYNNVYYYDISKPSTNFTQFVSNKTNRPLNFITNYKLLKYDIIIAVDVLEHLEAPIECIKSLKSLLNSNGIIITTGLCFAINNNLPMHLKSNVFLRKTFDLYIKNNFLIYFYHVSDSHVIYGLTIKNP
jgi:2-polyprenyl-3-methyl-5-hydroxy-6-metoxy-1,4-benzoquinol methylase